jgi:hypothetical protein
MTIYIGSGIFIGSGIGLDGGASAPFNAVLPVITGYTI